MAQEYNSIAVIGAGASGCICAYHLLNAGFEVSLFDKKGFFKTILPTGGGRCNLAHAIFDTKELAQNFPRGEKFLYSVFSRFSTEDTINLFSKIGIELYTQEDGRIFPKSNSSEEVYEKVLNRIKSANFIKEEILNIENLETGYKLKTTKSEYFFNKVIIAIGGHSSFNLLKNFDINIISQRPSLVGLKTEENFSDLNGIVIKNARCENLTGDLLFTNFGISAPLIYKISSIKAFDKFPYELNIDLVPDLTVFQEILNKNSRKDIKNILSQFIPEKMALYILDSISISHDLKGFSINKNIREKILEKIHNFKVKVLSTNKGEETVSAGGIDLNEINSKTMEFKNYKNLYAIGEALNIDGFCGGFNLQNAWSTGFISSRHIIEQSE